MLYRNRSYVERYRLRGDSKLFSCQRSSMFCSLWLLLFMPPVVRSEAEVEMQSASARSSLAECPPAARLSTLLPWWRRGPSTFTSWRFTASPHLPPTRINEYITWRLLDRWTYLIRHYFRNINSRLFQVLTAASIVAAIYLLFHQKSSEDEENKYLEHCCNDLTNLPHNIYSTHPFNDVTTIFKRTKPPRRFLLWN